MDVMVKLDKGAYLPTRAHATDAGADLRTREPFVIRAHCSYIVDTGVHIETPKDCVTLIKSKSGLHIRDGITTTGVVDEGFDGEIRVKLTNNSPFDIRFDRGDKIAQILIMPVLYPGFIEVDEISGGERGSNGFGSTGR